MFDRVEKYDILEEIGHGGMATVYRARDTRLDRLVALKVMHPHLQGAKEARARFEREAQTVARLRHRGLLEIYDYSGEDSRVSFLATELLTGPTLKRFGDEHAQIPAELAACMVLQVAHALAAAHDAGVIHRDVKPENVMFHQGHVKLTDFGIAQLVDAQGMTTTGQVLGSPGHMAPEQIEGKDCTAQSDLFSLGTVLYLLAVGELPFQGKNPHQILKRIVEGRYPDPLLVRASVGAPLARIIQRCLETDLEKRYASVAELAKDLCEFVSGSGIDDPDAALAAYLKDPEGYAKSFHARLIKRLIERGEGFQRTHRVPAALDDFNRVLALDEGNPQVLAAVQRLGRRSRVRRVGLWATAAFAVAAACAGAFAMVRGASPEASPSLPVEVVGKLPQADPEGVAVAGRSSDPRGASGSADRKPQPARAGASQTGAQPRARDDAPRSTAEPATSESVPRVRRASSPRAARGRGDSTSGRVAPSPAAPEGPPGPRTVRFRPFPANVSISVDGGPEKPFGPSFREVALEPGVHSFKFVAAHDCCEDLEFQQEIPAGPGTTTLRRSLKFKPAGLYVVTDHPANVVVDGGAVTGRSRNVLRVPHAEDLLQTHEVEVTADGRKPYRARIQLQAGQVKTLDVSLAPAEVKTARSSSETSE